MKQQKALDREDRADWRNFQMAELQAEEKKRADEIQAEKEKMADEIQMAKVETDKELAIKHMELNAQAQASSSAAVDPPLHNRDAKWEKTTWAIKLSELLTGRAMDVYTRMSDTDTNDYEKHS